MDLLLGYNSLNKIYLRSVDSHLGVAAKIMPPILGISEDEYVRTSCHITVEMIKWITVKKPYEFDMWEQVDLPTKKLYSVGVGDLGAEDHEFMIYKNKYVYHSFFRRHGLRKIEIDDISLYIEKWKKQFNQDIVTYQQPRNGVELVELTKDSIEELIRDA